ncbi:MAG: DUF2490 domain-containing protein [Candidatus Omnitrophica bacterium]|nr:DUF2490 domain-containing protein [Candidatus Omnitrophota bacterium]
MKLTKILFFGSFLIGIALRAYAFDDGDFQIWNQETQEKKISNNTRITAEEEFRLGNNAGNFYYQHYDLGIVHDFNKFLGAGFGFRYVLEKSNSPKFQEEDMPYLLGLLNWELAGTKFNSRSRFEYRHFDYKSDFWRYRNKITARFPWKFTKLEIQPFLADEGFLTFNRVMFSENRFYAGVGMSLTKNLKLDIYYLLRSNRSSGNWNNANVFGTSLKISF